MSTGTDIHNIINDILYMNCVPTLQIIVLALKGEKTAYIA